MLLILYAFQVLQSPRAPHVPYQILVLRESFLGAKITHQKENIYSVSSESRPNMSYMVRKEMDQCNCKLKCQFCSACFHLYTCTCLDASINNTVCKHIHLVHTGMSIKGESNKNSIKSFYEDCDQKYFQKLALSNVLANHGSTNKENLLQKTRYLYVLI